MAIWAKLTQGNGRGTCFWITHKLIFFVYLYEFINKNTKNPHKSPRTGY